VFLHKDFYLLPYLSTNLIPPPFPSRDAEEKKEEKKRRKKRKTGQATLGPNPATTAAPTTLPRATGEEKDRASMDA
jgi:hypothetical protein